MKRTHAIGRITLLVLLWGWDPAYPQVTIRLGVDAGLNFANQSFSNDPIYPKRFRTGVMIGGLAEIGISDLWYLQLEPRYIQKGMKETGIIITGNDPTPLGTTDLVYKFDYLEIPVLLKARLGGGHFKPLVFAGPNIGFLISAKRGEAIYDFQQSRITQQDIDVAFGHNTVDLSIDLGAGGEYEISSTVSLLANVRYSMGLSDLNSIHVINYLACQDCPHPPISAIKSYGIQVLVGTLLRL
jgi:outer membrane protein with beta-barrel domain